MFNMVFMIGHESIKRGQEMINEDCSTVLRIPSCCEKRENVMDFDSRAFFSYLFEKKYDSISGD